ncbi:uncharacterized protein BYT42DRAFT_493096 [Radiomyces spectabilis]|uniref:uncharacterized protein n=1 Tax=Radiomyces spectabilis TaxID=64574 RepID=UPI0022209CA1|nr:uncharacterized protein BYT42DRAFT_493096 [Radiomyces spectabilis]KAI8384694.1 hypothetical protein BYT42DRAFT_493096 [Radiomyces spectabilis]
MLHPVVLPATCELCGQWMPSHAAACPRNGKHPSQWSLWLPSTLETSVSSENPLNDDLYPMDDIELLPSDDESPF